MLFIWQKMFTFTIAVFYLPWDGEYFSSVKQLPGNTIQPSHDPTAEEPDSVQSNFFPLSMSNESNTLLILERKCPSTQEAQRPEVRTGYETMTSLSGISAGCVYVNIAQESSWNVIFKVNYKQDNIFVARKPVCYTCWISTVFLACIGKSVFITWGKRKKLSLLFFYMFLHSQWLYLSCILVL